MYMNSREAARYLGLSPKTLANLRVQGGGPAFRKWGARTVRYERAALDDYVSQKEAAWRAKTTTHNAPASQAEALEGIE